jgi:hypothetical protein
VAVKNIQHMEKTLLQVVMGEDTPYVQGQAAVLKYGI